MPEDDFVKEIERLAADPKGTGKPRVDAPVKERKKVSAPSFRAKPLKPRLESFFVGMGMLVYARDQVCGAIIAEHAPAMAEAYSSWADQSPRVRAMLERLLSGGAGTEALMSMVPVIIVVLAHHNMLPAGMAQRFATVNPEANGHAPSGENAPSGNTPPAA